MIYTLFFSIILFTQDDNHKVTIEVASFYTKQDCMRAAKAIQSPTSTLPILQKEVYCVKSKLS